MSQEPRDETQDRPFENSQASQLAESGSKPTNTPHAAVHDNPANGWQRCHPTALVVQLVETIKSSIGVVLSLFVVVRVFVEELGAWSWALPALAAVLAACWPPVAWATTRYRLTEDGVELRSGLVFRKHRTMSYDHIHAITATSPAYMQPFGVIRLTISSGDITAGNITLDAVPLELQATLESLRVAPAREAEMQAETASQTYSHTPVTDDHTGKANTSGSPVYVESVPEETNSVRNPASAQTISESGSIRPDSTASTERKLSATPPDRCVFRASTRDIILFALTDIGFLVAGAVVWNFFEQLRDFLPESWSEAASDSFNGLFTRGLLTAVAAIAGMLVVLLAVSVVISLLRFHGFEVHRRGDDLVVTRGLITRREMVMPISRVQTVLIRQSPLRRLFGLCSVQLGLSASADAGQTQDLAGAKVLPVIAQRRVRKVLADMLPEWDLREPQFRRTGRGLTRYFLFMPVVVTLVTALVTVALWVSPVDRAWPISFTILVAALALWIPVRWMKARADGYAFPDTQPDHIVVSSVQGVTWFTLYTRRARVQYLRRSQPAWRVHAGVERVQMPLFVMNGPSVLYFAFARRADADILQRWLETVPRTSRG